MPSYLGSYDGCASNRSHKFRRAVQSFIDQHQQNSELIIVADGCPDTSRILHEMYDQQQLQDFQEAGHPIKVISISKQPTWSGTVRNTGIEAATGEVIAYLDGDDLFMPGHLQVIWSAFVNMNPANHRRWVYFNDHLANADLTIMRTREAHLASGGIGTGMFAHEKSLWTGDGRIPGVKWPDGYGHDWLFIQRLWEVCPHTRKLVNGGKYLTCHLAGSIIDY